MPGQCPVACAWRPRSTHLQALDLGLQPLLLLLFLIGQPAELPAAQVSGDVRDVGGQLLGGVFPFRYCVPLGFQAGFNVLQAAPGDPDGTLQPLNLLPALLRGR